MLLRYTVGAAYLYPERRHWDDESDHWDKYRAYLEEFPAEGFPAVHWIWSGFASKTQVETYEFGLDVLISAIGAFPKAPSRT
jgi:hypothetical protein